MGTVKIGRSPSLGGGHQSLSRTQAILLETMQLVETRKSLPVPNHLLESKIYSKIAGNSVVQARPAVIHFSGFELGITQTMVLRLGNVSTEVQRMHIIPPQTKYFNIKYKKNDRLVPGLTLDCVIEFTADEWRYYYDCVRVHCKGEENLVIPIHAYPVMGTDEFPKNLAFPPIPVGQRSERVIPLRCNAPIDFEFQLTYLQPHSAFTVEPMAGLVPAQGEVDLVVTFSPTEFSTAHMKLQLVISQFNSMPLVCSVTGNSLPGLAKQIAEQTFGYDDEDILLDPRSITPVERARKKRKARNKESGPPLGNIPKEVEKNGIRFPSNLDTPFAVGQVLNQEPGKLRIKDIREAVLAKKGEVEASTRQMKEAMFEMAVRRDVYEERQNQLRWQSKVGDDQISLQQKHDILDARTISWRDYKLDRGDPVPGKEAVRTCTESSFRRTLRDSAQIGKEGVKFDTYTNDLWSARHSRMARFQQAARKIIIRRRADKKIKGLRQMVLDWSKKKFNPGASCGFDDDDEEEEMIEQETGSRLQMAHVSSITFPTYVEPNVKDDMAVDALGAVPYKPTEVIIPKKTPYFSLKVPQQYSLMGYTSHNVHDASVSYVPPNLAKELRTGAEDEIITLLPPALREPSLEEEPVNEGDLRVEEVVEMPTSTEPISLKPPEALFKPMEYPPLHIFNPAPGLQVFQAPLPYAEVDPDFHLCPLPRYTSTTSGPHAATQKNYLDREDVIHGVMSWKKFPSQGLASLTQTPTLINVWAPRWSDPFVSDLLPVAVPEPLDGLRLEDRNNIADEDEEDADVTLVPDMVAAQFPLIDRTALPEEKPKQKDTTDENAGLSMKSHHHGQHHQKHEEKPKSLEIFPQGNKLPPTNVPVSHHGPVPREQRERELDYFMKKKYNRLGAKINQRIEQLNTLKTNSDLVLK